MKSWDEKYGDQMRERAAEKHRGLMDREVGLKGAAQRGADIASGVKDRAVEQHIGLMDRQTQWGAPRPGSAAGAAPSTARVSGRNVGAASAPAPIAKSPGMAATSGANGPAKLDSWPKAFRAIAEKINELCEWFGGLKAGPGIAITKSKGATIISLVGGKNGSGGSPTATELHYSDSDITIDIDADGVKLTNLASGDFVKLYPTGAFGIVDAGTGRELLIAPNDLDVVGGSDVILRETTIYDGGVPMSAYVLRSELF